MHSSSGENAHDIYRPLHGVVKLGPVALKSSFEVNLNSKLIIAPLHTSFGMLCETYFCFLVEHPQRPAVLGATCFEENHSWKQTSTTPMMIKCITKRRRINLRF